MLGALRALFVYVFADRLLLKMKKVDDPGTQAVVSTLIFDHGGDQLGSSLDDADDPAEEARRDEGQAPGREVEGVASVVKTPEKDRGKRLAV